MKRALSWGDVGAGEMAEHLGYSKAQISRYLNDKGEPPRRPILISWALRCGVPFEWLAYGMSESGPDDPAEQVSSSSPCTYDNVRTLRPALVSLPFAEPSAA